MNLQEMFPKYRIEYEEGWKAQRDEKEAYQRIACRGGGHIMFWGPDLAFVDRDGGQIGVLVARLKWTKILQDGDDGKTVGFPVTIFLAVAAIVHPRTTRKQIQRRAG